MSNRRKAITMTTLLVLLAILFAGVYAWQSHDQYKANTIDLDGTMHDVTLIDNYPEPPTVPDEPVTTGNTSIVLSGIAMMIIGAFGTRYLLLHKKK